MNRVRRIHDTSLPLDKGESEGVLRSGRATPLDPPLVRGEAQRRKAFTLIEILVTISIMAILAGLVAAAVFQAENAAKYRKTESLIMKLHNDIMLRMEEMRERRLPYEADAVMTLALGTGQHSAGYLLNKAWYQLAARRELQRLEMPDRFSDIDFTGFTGQTANPPTYFTNATPLSLAYVSAVAPVATHPKLLSYESAECLYLIVTTSAPGDNAERLSFKNDEVGDVDGDGLKEFLDAWGRPIVFIRWPAGFVSDLQPEFSIDPTDQNDPDYDEYQKPGVDWTNYPTVRKRSKNYYVSRKPDRNHDPFDVRNVANSDLVSGKLVGPKYYRWPERGYRLVPLICSAGRDGVWDIEFGIDKAQNYRHAASGPIYDPYAMIPPTAPQQDQRQLGATFATNPKVDQSTEEIPADGADSSSDNIYNHYLAQGER